VDFLVVNRPSAYNVIVGRPSLNKLRVVTSTYHLMMKFPTPEGVREVKRDRIVPRKCYNTSLKKASNPTPLTIRTVGRNRDLPKREPVEPLEEVTVDEGKVVKVGSQLTLEVQDALITFLRENMEVFAWTHEDMLGINLDDILH
jgi:hypothetical protein